MNKIPKCTSKNNPLVKANKKVNKIPNNNRLNIITNKTTTRSYSNNSTNLINNKEIKLTKKTSNFNKKVKINI